MDNHGQGIKRKRGGDHHNPEGQNQQ